jgi:hypothetical protein
MVKTFEIEREVELRASPDAVQAVATGEGIASWMFHGEITRGLGSELPDGSKVTPGSLRMTLRLAPRGPMAGSTTLTYRIDPRGDGVVMRYVHSGVIDEASWDEQYDAVQPRSATASS